MWIRFATAAKAKIIDINLRVKKVYWTANQRTVSLPSWEFRCSRWPFYPGLVSHWYFYKATLGYAWLYKT
jgi:hypothetical protein